VYIPVTNEGTRQLEILRQAGHIQVVKQPGLRLVMDYDLRWDKYAGIVKGNDRTAFVNRARTLVHVMRDGEPFIVIRLPLDLKGRTRLAIRRIIKEKLYDV
jgi:hypothetical protein